MLGLFELIFKYLYLKINSLYFSTIATSVPEEVGHGWPLLIKVTD